ncbi:SCO2523 family variant P-loop protein [Nocardia amikacinitolerans]|uniref:SCO2523 family variant P-loop protein n=1 Tax=Nocardia amikacinitolerans TaxID=756689 RepID=UPI0020A4719A|nr:SCO2523 family variant P-loop protein [Nocardia amikacinitolerans]MCP2289997.1 CobQ/CobB/MinD/ParA nucleotide binding domain-containing protein [Nocardia amikacinitolerans]
MLVFATSDKGGTGRSVTSCNLAYRLCLGGKNVAYLDFDFGSPTAGALFEVSAVERGVSGGAGLHSYLLGEKGTATRVDVRAKSDRGALRQMPTRSGKLVLFPGDEGGAEFLGAGHDMVERCLALLTEALSEFHVVLVDLSAGRSAAAQLVLQATARRQLAGAVSRWLVFHRWTRQHIMATSALVHGPNGLLSSGVEYGHDPVHLTESIRYVRTAVPDPFRGASSEKPAQARWLLEQHQALKRLASVKKLGADTLLGETPMEPVLQWREQVLVDADVDAQIANETTVGAFGELARRLTDPAVWETF